MHFCAIVAVLAAGGVWSTNAAASACFLYGAPRAGSASPWPLYCSDGSFGMLYGSDGPGAMIEMSYRDGRSEFFRPVGPLPDPGEFEIHHFIGDGGSDIDLMIRR
jgi:hypothetical protein